MARKRQVSKGSDVAGRRGAYEQWRLHRDREKVHLSIPSDVARRLASYASLHGVPASDVVAQAVMVETRGFVCYLQPDVSPSTHVAGNGPGSPPEPSTALKVV